MRSVPFLVAFGLVVVVAVAWPAISAARHYWNTAHVALTFTAKP